MSTCDIYIIEEEYAKRRYDTCFRDKPEDGKDPENLTEK
jgi:hypothetical protein